MTHGVRLTAAVQTSLFKVTSQGDEETSKTSILSDFYYQKHLTPVDNSDISCLGVDRK